MHLVHILNHIWHAQYMHDKNLFVYTKDRTQNTNVWVSLINDKSRGKSVTAISSVATDGYKSRWRKIAKRNKEREERALHLHFFSNNVIVSGSNSLFSLFFSFVSHHFFLLEDIDSNKARSQKTSIDQQTSLMPKNTEECSFLSLECKRRDLNLYSLPIRTHSYQSNIWENICWLHNDLNKLRSWLKKKDFSRENFFNFCLKTFAAPWLNDY